MCLKRLRRRLSIDEPRVIVRSHLPCPLGWAAVALVFGFSGVLASRAFDFGNSSVGLDSNSTRNCSARSPKPRNGAASAKKLISIANTAESPLKVDMTVQDKLAQQLNHGEVLGDTIAIGDDPSILC